MVCSLSCECMTLHMTHLQFKCNVENRFSVESAPRQRHHCTGRLSAALAGLSGWIQMRSSWIWNVCIISSLPQNGPGPGSGVSSLRYDRVAWLARGRGVLEFLQLAGGSLRLQLHLDEWQSEEKLHRHGEMYEERPWSKEEGIIKYLFYLSGFYVKSPPFQLLFTELHQLNLILEICFMIFSDLICCEFVQVLFDHKRGRVSETFTSIPLNISR